jgi:hypothetical protein
MFGNLEQLARFEDRTDHITLESAQLFLKYGVTTVRDSYGQLRSLVRVRDAIARGETVFRRFKRASTKKSPKAPAKSSRT